MSAKKPDHALDRVTIYEDFGDLRGRACRRCKEPESAHEPAPERPGVAQQAAREAAKEIDEQTIARHIAGRGFDSEHAKADEWKRLYHSNDAAHEVTEARREASRRGLQAERDAAIKRAEDAEHDRDIAAEDFAKLRDLLGD